MGWTRQWCVENLYYLMHSDSGKVSGTLKQPKLQREAATSHNLKFEICHWPEFSNGEVVERKSLSAPIPETRS